MKPCERGLFGRRCGNGIHDGEKLTNRLSAQHSYTRRLEVRYAFEERRGGQVATDMEDATTLVKTLYTLQNLLLEHVEIPRESLWRKRFTRL